MNVDEAEETTAPYVRLGHILLLAFVAGCSRTGLDSGVPFDASVILDGTVVPGSNGGDDGGSSGDGGFPDGPASPSGAAGCLGDAAVGVVGPCLGGAATCGVACSNGGTTSVTGTVYAPNGTLPIYDAVVYVPNSPLAPIDKGVSCNQCGAPLSGAPLAIAFSDATGHFVLNDVPVGKNIPLVVQLGKWRRETTLPEVKRCISNALQDPNLTRLPKNQKEGNIPHIALTTGSCDNMGCMLPKIGIDPSEFGYESDSYAKAVNVYTNGGDGLNGATPEYGLWSSLALLSTYDMGIFSCNCDESLSYGDPAFAAVTRYLDNGGRIFTTDFQYTWYRYSPDTNLGAIGPGNLSATGIGTINGGAPPGDTQLVLNTGFPKASALAQWLGVVFPGSPYGQVTCDNVFDNVQSLNAKAQTWASSAPGPDPRVFTVNTPAGAPAANQCGKGVHIDAHVDVSTSDTVGCNGTTCYPGTCTSPLTQGEAMFAFFFFDLASCISSCN